MSKTIKPTLVKMKTNKRCLPTSQTKITGYGTAGLGKSCPEVNEPVPTDSDAVRQHYKLARG